MSTLYTGRKYPYTLKGIKRVPCCRCGEPSSSQWEACANGNRHVGICTPCDIKLNDLALKFMNIPNRTELMRRYRAEKEDQD